MTIYVPDDLAVLVKKYDDLNVSAVCQAALRQELDRRNQLAELDEGMERMVVYVEQRETDVAFVGKELYYGDPGVSVYLTRRHRLAVYDANAQALHDFDSFEDLADEDQGFGRYGELVAAVAQRLGEKHVIELDI